MLTLACWITSTRFLLAPLMYWQLSAGTKSGLIYGSLILLLSGLTDVLDGWVARSRHETSELGKILDPLADKLVLFLMFLALYKSWMLSGWMMAIYGIKELGQVLSGVYLYSQFKELIPANKWGKGSTCGFFLGFFTFVVSPKLGLVILVISFLVSVYALYTYYLAFLALKARGAAVVDN